MFDFVASILGGAKIGADVFGAKAAKKAAKASAAQEQVRKEQLQLDSARQRRQVARSAAVAQANALAAGVAAGSFNSSQVEGVQASLASQEGEQTSVISQAEKLGFSIFDLNQQITKAKSEQATSSAISNAIGSIAGNSSNILNVGSTLYNNLPTYSSTGSTDASATISGGLV